MMAPGDGLRATYLRVSAGGLGARTIDTAWSLNRLRMERDESKGHYHGSCGT